MRRTTLPLDEATNQYSVAHIKRKQHAVYLQLVNKSTFTQTHTQWRKTQI